MIFKRWIAYAFQAFNIFLKLYGATGIIFWRHIPEGCTTLPSIAVVKLKQIIRLLVDEPAAPDKSEAAFFMFRDAVAAIWLPRRLAACSLKLKAVFSR